MSNEDKIESEPDEFGILFRKKSSRGGWVNIRREHELGNFNIAGAKTKDFMTAITCLGFNLAMNEMADRIEVNHKPITDSTGAVILNGLRDMGMYGEVRMKDAMLEMAHRNRYHPIKDYLAGLPAWDGLDHIKHMLDHFRYKDGFADSGRVFIRKWMIGCVTKILYQEQNFMLVLDGPQGIGKSEWAKWLGSQMPAYTIAGGIKPEDKDSFIRLISNWIWEVGELQATTRKADVEALKDFITRDVVTVRMPFARFDTHKPAAASLVGTINENGAGFLVDRTGNRRFAVAVIDSIDWDYTTGVNLTQLWAQIYHLAQNGERAQLTAQEKELQNQINEEYEVISATIELLHGAYEVDHTAVNPISARSILMRLQDAGLQGNQRASMMEIAAYLQSKGVKKLKRNDGVYYSGLREI
jgi:predicted P-loop ATPase